MRNTAALLGLCVTLLATAGCASAPPLAVPAADQSKIASLPNVEIFYHRAVYSVADGIGAGHREINSIAGAPGASMPALLEASSRLTLTDRINVRSKEFSDTVADSNAQDINLAQAQRLADLIRRTGRVVKLTVIDRPEGAIAGAMRVIPTQGYAPLVLRTTTGFAAANANAPYRSFSLTEFSLKDLNGQVVIAWGTLKRDSGATYQTFSGLKNDHAFAASVLSRDLSTQATEVFDQTFDNILVAASAHVMPGK